MANNYARADQVGVNTLWFSHAAYADQVGVQGLIMQSVQLYAKTDQVGVNTLWFDPPKTTAYADQIGANVLYAVPMPNNRKPFFHVREY